MKSKILLGLLIFTSFHSFSQSIPDWEDWKGKQYIDFMETVEFKPKFQMKNMSMTQIKTLMLTMDDKFYKQLAINAWYFCDKKSDDYYELWNMYYTPMEKSTWDLACRACTALMELDGLIKQPR
mgnify:CR=1 FL=1|jgi:hypothetical protein